eukprot:GFYU01021198.1.p1 GENE.GFYU01021198.1~~GFYU01021198.1.p1  ORF type:complete len:332 (+),score=63.77 GFYU01021198.1:133-1128(+)
MAAQETPNRSEPPSPTSSTGPSESNSSAAPNQAGLTLSSNLAQLSDGQTTYQLALGDPKWVQGTLSWHVEYSISTQTSAGEAWTVMRRYKQFAWLRRQLGRICPASIVPPLPSTRGPSLQGAMNEEQLQTRRRALIAFLHNVNAHPMLSRVNVFKHFLSVTNISWKTDVKLEKEFPRCNLMTRSLRSIKAPMNYSELGDDSLDVLNKYCIVVERQLDTARTLVQTVAHHRKLMGNAIVEYGECFSQCANMENDSVHTLLRDYADVNTKLGKVAVQQSEDETSMLMEPLTYWSGMLKSMRDVVRRRGDLCFLLREAATELNSQILKRREWLF